MAGWWRARGGVDDFYFRAKITLSFSNQLRKAKSLMPARTIEQSFQFRKWVDAALKDGAASPSQILEWIEQHKSKDHPSPSLPTISKILDEKGYKPTGRRWEKKGKDHETNDRG